MKALVSDIGGTNVRYGYYDTENGQVQHQVKFALSNFESIESSIEHYLQTHNLPVPSLFVMGIAGAVLSDTVVMSNSPWVVSCGQLKDRFNFNKVIAVNDFALLGYSLKELPNQGFECLHAVKNVNAMGNFSLIGVGTGLGVAILSNSRTFGSWHVSATEGGWMTAASIREEEYEILRAIKDQVPYETLVWEHVFQGAGILRFYNAYCEVHGHAPNPYTLPKEVLEEAKNTRSGPEAEMVRAYLGLFGSYCGDIIVAHGAWKGLYIGGGIIPKMKSFISESKFLERFWDKTPLLHTHLSSVPIFLITKPLQALEGGRVLAQNYFSAQNRTPTE